MRRPASLGFPGWLLEARGNARPREMAIAERSRFVTELGLRASSFSCGRTTAAPGRVRRGRGDNVVTKSWVHPDGVDPAQVGRLAEELGLSRPIAQILVARGKVDPDDVRRYLDPRVSEMTDPREFRGAEAALDRLRRALRDKERILIVGDFDVDGVTGTSLAFRTLSKLGANVGYLLPKRLVHGYGLSMKVLPDVLAQRPGLVLTVDCGIRSVDEVAELSAQGIDTIITDHHEPGPELPPAVAVVDPKQDGCPYPDKRLAGVGVMYQLMSGLTRGMEHEIELERDLDLVALGTVADVVPLDGENRALVAEGLAVMNRREKPGMMALVQVAEIEDRVDAWHLGYLLGPRVNAAGRLGDAELAVQLFTAIDTSQAMSLAGRLDRENRERQELSALALDQAIQAVDQGVAGNDPDGIVLACNAWHPGVVGIATSKLVERFYRPSVLIAMDGDVGRGSVRSISGVDVCAVLDGCADLLVQYGGHEMAAGLTIPRENVPAFRERFAELAAAQMTPESRTPRLPIDVEFDPSDIDLSLADHLDRLAPFGYGNPKPRVLLRGVERANRPRVVGRGHLKMGLRRPSAPTLDCIGFDLGDRSEGLPDGPLDLVGTISANEWNGKRTAQFQILDLRASEAQPAT